MPRISVNRLFLVVLSAGVLAGLISQQASACPFCLGSQQLTLRERIETPDASVLVKWRSGERGDINTGQPDSTTFEVLKVWRGEIDHDQPLTIDRYQEGCAGDLFLLVGSKLEDVIRWDRAIPLSGAALAYVNSLPSSDATIGERLKHAFGHLESADTTIANDAFDVLAGARYEDIAAERAHLNVEDLRRWVHDPQTHVMRLGVYGMLLGLAGSVEDIPGLRRKILLDDQDKTIRIGIDGVMGGFLLLTGEQGLRELDAAFLKATDVSLDNLNATASALRFMWEYGDGVISRDRLRESMRLALDHEPQRCLAITDLARWQDWSITDRLITLYGDETTDLFTRRSIIGFLFAASLTEMDDLSDDERAAVERAGVALETIREADPALYQRAERSFIRPVTK